jgi:hypothetical protein
VTRAIDAELPNDPGDLADQTKRLRERGATFEEEEWILLGGRPVEERIERPTDPEVLLDVLNGRPKSASGCQEQVVPLVIPGSDHLMEDVVHHGRAD